MGIGQFVAQQFQFFIVLLHERAIVLEDILGEHGCGEEMLINLRTIRRLLMFSYVHRGLWSCFMLAELILALPQAPNNY